MRISIIPPFVAMLTVAATVATAGPTPGSATTIEITDNVLVKDTIRRARADVSR